MTSGKFEIDFIDPQTGKRETVLIELTDKEKQFCRKQSNPDLLATAHALRQAYRQVPKGFLHIRDGIRTVPIH